MSSTEQPNVVDVNPMEQLPQDQSRAESPLFHADLSTVAQEGAKTGGVAIAEKALLTHLILRGSPHNTAFMSGVKTVLGFALPERLQSVWVGDVSAWWLGPDEWLVVAPASQAFSLETDFRAALSGHYAITNVSGGQTLLLISGASATEVLRKSTAYDVSPRHFPVGKVVTTTFAKSQAVIRRVTETEWELVIRRSFADYLWLWLQDASAEYGLVVYA